MASKPTQRGRKRARSKRRGLPQSQTALGVAGRSFVAAVAARKTLEQVAECLHGAGIPFMPIKGAYLQLVLYEDPSERFISDVDALVPPERLLDAVGELQRRGYRVLGVARSFNEIMLESPQGLTLDLHRRLFNPFRYRLSTAEVFARAHLDTHLLSSPVYEADPMDTFAHLVGKFVSDHAFHATEQRLSELSRFALRFGLSARALASHLERCGLGRATRLACLLAESHSLPFFPQLLEGLSIDPAGQRLARWVRALGPSMSRRGLGSVPSHLLSGSLVRGGASLAGLVGTRLRYRIYRGLPFSPSAWAALVRGR